MNTRQPHPLDASVDPVEPRVDPPFDVKELNERPDPGIPTVCRVPRELRLIVAPLPPNEVLTPDLLKFNRTPGIIFTDFRNRKAIPHPKGMTTTGAKKSQTEAALGARRRAMLDASAIIRPRYSGVSPYVGGNGDQKGARRCVTVPNLIQDDLLNLKIVEQPARKAHRHGPSSLRRARLDSGEESRFLAREA